MKIFYSATCVVLFALMLAACSQPHPETKDVSLAPPAIDSAVTQRVFDHHFEVFKANDLEGTLADYADDAVLITPFGTYNGKTAIRENFVGAFKAFPKDSTTFAIKHAVVHKDVAYFIWEATTPKFKLTYGTDTFIIQNGKIVRQTYAGVTE